MGQWEVTGQSSLPPISPLSSGFLPFEVTYMFTIMKQLTNIFFRILRQTQMVEQSSHTSCHPEFPRDMFAFWCCHGTTTSPWELSCMAVLTIHDPFLKFLIKEQKKKTAGQELVEISILYLCCWKIIKSINTLTVGDFLPKAVRIVKKSRKRND